MTSNSEKQPRLRKSPPAMFSERNLQRNLAALYRSNPVLVNRICLPAASQHIRFTEQGHLFYRLHRQFYPLNLQLSNKARNGGAENQETLIFCGIVDGDDLRRLIAAKHIDHAILWERDPWLLRLLLMRYDFTAAISAGHLEFALGTDLLKLRSRKPVQTLWNSFLAKIYAWEKLLFENDSISKKAMVCTGNLLVDDICQALHDDGFTIFQLAVKDLAVEEIRFALEQFRPEFLFSINYPNGLAEICQPTGIPLYVWEIDPATDKIDISPAAAANSALFSYNKANLHQHVSAGFGTVHYLPLATNPQRRYPRSQVENTYMAEVSFVGASMVEQAEKCRDQFFEF